jgi:acetate kinase
VRANIASRLSWLGVVLDAEANAQHGPRISSSTSAVACYVIPTNEELMMARHAQALLRTTADHTRSAGPSR